jgi:hypothetical protein
MNSPYPKSYSVIPVLARRSASARRRENGNPGVGIKKNGFLLLQE